MYILISKKIIITHPIYKEIRADVFGEFGIDAYKENDGFYIADVLSGSPASKCDMYRGQIIESINGRPANEISQYEFDMLAGDATAIKLKIRLKAGGTYILRADGGCR